MYKMFGENIDKKSYYSALFTSQPMPCLSTTPPDSTTCTGSMFYVEEFAGKRGAAAGKFLSTFECDACGKRYVEITGLLPESAPLIHDDPPPAN